jgi:multisubunit Na+/H+ antiporter MnhB subunit
MKVALAFVAGLVTAATLGLVALILEELANRKEQGR